jgi:hypothetical protein
MEYDKDKKEIILNRVINDLDEFVLDFTKILGKKYVVVSGYVSILFGRSRATEDIDLLVPDTGKDEFLALWKKIHDSGFECLNTSKPDEAFDSLNEYAIRFARKGKPVPNMEFKKITNDIQKYSFDNKLIVQLKKGQLYISPLEMQIAYKLFLGSEKDIEDAKHIYSLFEEKINKDELLYLANKLKVTDKLKFMEKKQ